MKKIRLSKNKFLLEYNVPIYIKGQSAPVSNIDISIKYKWNKDYSFIPSRLGYVIVKSSVDKCLEKLAFKWKVCNAQRIGNKYVIEGVKAHYMKKEFDGDELMMVKFIMVENEEFLMKLREKKLNELLF